MKSQAKSVGNDSAVAVGMTHEALNKVARPASLHPALTRFVHTIGRKSLRSFMRSPLRNASAFEPYEYANCSARVTDRPIQARHRDSTLGHQCRQNARTNGER